MEKEIIEAISDNESSISFQISFGFQLLIANIFIVASYFAKGEFQALGLLLFGFCWLLFAGITMANRHRYLDRKMDRIESEIKYAIAMEKMRRATQGLDNHKMKGGRKK